MKKLLSALAAMTIIAAMLGTMSSCKKDKESSPEPSSDNSENVSETNPTPTSNSLVVNKISYSRDQKSTFSNNYYCNTTFETVEANTPNLAIVLPNSSPATGDYKLVKYTSSSSYPGKNKACMTLYLNNASYSSTLDTTMLVHIVNEGDSIEVSFENIKLYKSNNTEYKVVSAKYKIGTQTSLPVFTGSASFTNGSANKITYSNPSGIYHKFMFTSSSLGSLESLTFYFAEMPSVTKTYSITEDEMPSTSDEVKINIITNNLDFYSVNETGKSLSVIVNPNGTMSFSFSGVVAERSDLNGNTYTSTMGGSASLTQQQ